MKKSLVLTSLLIATVGLTSCGRKKPQVDTSTNTTMALTAELTCAGIKAKDKGKLSASKFVDTEKSTEVKDDAAANEFAKKVYAAAMTTDKEMDVKLLSPVFKSENEKLKAFKAEHKIILAQMGKGSENLEILMYKPNAKAGDGYKLFQSMFSNEKCLPAIKTIEKPMTKEQLEAAISQVKLDIESKTAELAKLPTPTEAEIEVAKTTLLTLAEEKAVLDAALVEAKKGTDADAIEKAEQAVTEKQAEIDAQQAIVDAPAKKLAIEQEILQLNESLKGLEEELKKLGDEK